MDVTSALALHQTLCCEAWPLSSMLHGIELCIGLLVREFGQGESSPELALGGRRDPPVLCVLKHKKVPGRWAGQRSSKQWEQAKNVRGGNS